MNTTKKMIVEEPIPGANWRVIKGAGSPDFDVLAKAEGFHALDVEDCRHRRQLAKVVDRDGYVFVVAKTIRYDAHTHRAVFEDFDMFVKHDSIITVEEEPDGVVSRVQRRFPDPIHATDVPHIFYAILDEIVDEYMVTLDSIGEGVNTLETHVWRNPSPAMLQRIFQMKRALIDFRRNAGTMREVVSQLIRHPKIQTGGDLENYYRDLHEHSIRVIEFIETYRDILNGALDIHLSAVANRTNEVMKVLTIYGTIALPLIVITGFYGMNIELPFQHSPHALGIVITLMVAFTGSVLFYFKRKQWF